MTTETTTDIGGEDHFSTRYAIILAICVNIDHKKKNKQTDKQTNNLDGSMSKTTICMYIPTTGGCNSSYTNSFKVTITTTVIQIRSTLSTFLYLN